MQFLPWRLEKVRGFKFILNWVGLVDNGYIPEMDMSGHYDGAIPEDKLREYLVAVLLSLLEKSFVTRVFSPF